MIQTVNWMPRISLASFYELVDETQTEFNYEEMMRLPSNPSQKNSKLKSSLCRNFMEEGFCLYGDKCQFAHGTEELKCNSQNHISYKTKPCHSFLKKGYCPYGTRCNFIHTLQPQAKPVHESYRFLVYEARTHAKSPINA